MPHANDALIARAYTAEDAAATISDVTLDESNDYEVRVEVEAGSALFGLNPPYQLDIYVRELAPGGAIVSDSDGGTIGLAGGNWANPGSVIKFTVGAGDIDAGAVYQVLAVLRVGGAGAQFATFAESALFMGV